MLSSVMVAGAMVAGLLCASPIVAGLVCCDRHDGCKDDRYKQATYLLHSLSHAPQFLYPSNLTSATWSKPQSMKYGIQAWFWSYKSLIKALGQVSRLCISMGATAVKCQQQSHMPMTAVEKHSLLRTSATVLRRTFDLHGECVDLSWRAAAMFDLEIQKLFFAGTTADP